MVLSASARWGLVGLSLLPFVLASPAWSDWDERFAPFYFDSNDPGTLYLDGEIDARSPLALGRAIDAVGEPRELILSSPGGSVYAALVMAREVDRLELTTIIPKSAGCYSACAYLYFAGANRRAEGQLGVHQISSSAADFDSGQVTLSDIVEALTEYGVPNEVLVLMLRTSSADIHVLSQDELQNYGLLGPRTGGTELALATTHSSAPSVTAPETSTGSVAPPSSPEATVISFVAQYQRDWSESNTEALALIRALYADQVEFYGESRNLTAVMDDKETFAERWPTRSYQLDRRTVTATCTTPTSCTVEGEVTWNAVRFDGAKRSVGRALLEMNLREINGHWHITGEDGHVIERN